MQVKRFTTFHVSGKKVDSKSYVAVIGDPGRKYTELVYINGTGVVLRKTSNLEAKKYCSDIVQGKNGLERTARQLLSAGKRLGITKGAKKFLKVAIDFDRAEIAKLI